MSRPLISARDQTLTHVHANDYCESDWAERCDREVVLHARLLSRNCRLVCKLEHFHMKFIAYDICMLVYVATSHAKVYISITLLLYRAVKGGLRASEPLSGYAPSYDSFSPTFMND